MSLKESSEGETDSSRYMIVTDLWSSRGVSTCSVTVQCEDYKTAYEACHQLMQVNYSAAWVECKALAEAVDFSDVAAKQVFYIFVVLMGKHIWCAVTKSHREIHIIAHI